MTESPHAQRKHSRCGASSADRWLNCPGSVYLSSTVDEPPSSPAALEGTRAHELAEKILFHWQANKYELDSKWLDELSSSLSIEDQEMLDHVLTYVNLCLDEVDQFDSPPTVRIEQRLTFSSDMDMFGTADFLATGMIDGIQTGVIVDLKYGKGKKVKTEDNPQLAYYAVALRLCSTKKLERIKVRIVQPRIEEFFSDQWFSSSDLDAWQSKLTLGAEEALWMLGKAKQPKYQEGSWCWFCPGKRVCPQIAERVNAKLVEEFSDL